VSAADSRAPICVALLAVVLLASDARAQPAKEIEESLTCQCGCGLTVHTCNHLQCSFAVPVKRDVAESLANGQTAGEILERYVARYGEKILSAPIPKGFNLAAYIAPYVAVAAGLGLIVGALRRMRRRSAAAVTRPGQAPRTDAQRAKLDRELEKLDS
jgi:cytochrome c-type biogenesis protein CcmH